jgi:lipopolysaccharide export system permease protein
MRFADTITHSIPLTNEADGDFSTSPSHLLLRQIRIAEREQHRRMAARKQSLATEAAFHMILGDFEGLNGRRWEDGFAELAVEQQRLHRIETEPFRRWATGFSCLAFVTIGIPLAIRLRASDVMTTFGACFLPILIGYYPLFAYGLDRAKSGALPPYCVWCGNLVCMAIGVWLFRRVIKY